MITTPQALFPTAAGLRAERRDFVRLVSAVPGGPVLRRLAFLTAAIAVADAVEVAGWAKFAAATLGGVR